MQRTKSGLKIEMQDAQFLKFLKKDGEYHSKLLGGKKFKPLFFMSQKNTSQKLDKNLCKT